MSTTNYIFLYIPKLSQKTNKKKSKAYINNQIRHDFKIFYVEVYVF